MKAFPLVLVLGILLFQIILLDKCPSKNVYDFQTIKIELFALKKIDLL